MSREIPAIHRGNVFRFQRAQIAGFVPVVEVATKKLQRFIDVSVASSRSIVSCVPVHPKS